MQMTIDSLGVSRYPSTLFRAVDEHARIPFRIVRNGEADHTEENLFEAAGPRKELYF